jgi:hypothetical protein
VPNLEFHPSIDPIKFPFYIPCFCSSDPISSSIKFPLSQAVLSTPVNFTTDVYLSPPKFFTFQRIKSLYHEHLAHTLFLRSVPQCISNDYLYYLLTSVGELAVFNTSYRSQLSFVVCTYYDIRCALVAYSFLSQPATMSNIKLHLLRHPELISRQLVADRMKKVVINLDQGSTHVRNEFDYENNEIYLFYLIAQCGDFFTIGLPLIKPQPFNSSIPNFISQHNRTPNTGSVVVFNIPTDMSDDFVKSSLSLYGEVMEVRKSQK